MPSQEISSSLSENNLFLISKTRDPKMKILVLFFDECVPVILVAAFFFVLGKVILLSLMPVLARFNKNNAARRKNNDIR